ncbi:hypothetical protein VPH35_049900 [Triticum aestivum]
MDEVYVQALVLAAVAVALLQLLKAALNPMTERPPPGPWKLPVIGSMHHLVNVLPHRKLRDLADAHGPLMMLQLGQTPLVVASSKETARLVLKTHDSNFATRPKLLAGQIVGYEWADILFSPSDDYWRKLRHLCTAEILSPKRVRSFRHIREDEVRMRVDQIRQAGPSAPVNLSVMFHNVTNSIVARAAFGKKRKNAAEFQAAIKSGVGLASGFNIPDLFPTWTTVLAKLTGMKRSLQDIHKTESNLQYLKMVIKEALRLHPPAPLLVPRESIDQCELEGYTVPAKSRVIINAWAIGRDPKYWEAAEEFLPERFEDSTVDFTGSSYEFLPFGAGRRMCPGFNYGLASMELALVGLLYHFDWSLPEGVAEVDMEEAPGLGVRRLTPLMLLATPFVPAAMA